MLGRLTFGGLGISDSKYVIWHLKNRCLHICSFHSQNAGTLQNILHDDWLKLLERLTFGELGIRSVGILRMLGKMHTHSKKSMDC